MAPQGVAIDTSGIRHGQSTDQEIGAASKTDGARQGVGIKTSAVRHFRRQGWRPVMAHTHDLATFDSWACNQFASAGCTSAQPVKVRHHGDRN